MRGVGEMAESMLEWYEESPWWGKLLATIPVLAVTVIAIALVSMWQFSGAAAVAKKVEQSKRRRDAQLDILEQRDRKLVQQVETSRERQEKIRVELDQSALDHDDVVRKITKAKDHKELYDAMSRLGGGKEST